MVLNYGGADLMWYGYAIETVFIVLDTVLVAVTLGILIYH
jgi:hypothetical protein